VGLDRDPAAYAQYVVDGFAEQVSGALPKPRRKRAVDPDDPALGRGGYVTAGRGFVEVLKIFRWKLLRQTRESPP